MLKFKKLKRPNAEKTQETHRKKVKKQLSSKLCKIKALTRRNSISKGFTYLTPDKGFKQTKNNLNSKSKTILTRRQSVCSIDATPKNSLSPISFRVPAKFIEKSDKTLISILEILS